jgi:hypothetical protein
VTNRYVIAAAAHNLGRMLRTLFGAGKPRALPSQGVSAAGFVPEMALARLRLLVAVATTKGRCRLTTAAAPGLSSPADGYRSSSTDG